MAKPHKTTIILQLEEIDDEKFEMGRSCGKNGILKNWRKEQMHRKWNENGSDEDREIDRRIALRETWKKWENNRQ